ncbi:uncharacterized protein H6S33_000762 [Morchella sextelata]|uniref:uncharacterized protein n=1 Tax=Morchella sextelata TaxID=1174677 RepID=UPI001D053A2F|nr:uncharacterized protein H6S33_000762 [Morchella sextelata]KAH0615126.1 hypothetical protein H6S33_000762 [Morchella sextelata]
MFFLGGGSFFAVTIINYLSRYTALRVATGTLRIVNYHNDCLVRYWYSCCMHSSAVEKYAVRSLHALNPGKETPRILIIDRWQGSRRLIYRVRGSYK